MRKTFAFFVFAVAAIARAQITPPQPPLPPVTLTGINTINVDTAPPTAVEVQRAQAAEALPLAQIALPAAPARSAAAEIRLLSIPQAAIISNSMRLDELREEAWREQQWLTANGLVLSINGLITALARKAGPFDDSLMDEARGHATRLLAILADMEAITGNAARAEERKLAWLSSFHVDRSGTSSYNVNISDSTESPRSQPSASNNVPPQCHEETYTRYEKAALFAGFDNKTGEARYRMGYDVVQHTKTVCP